MNGNLSITVSEDGAKGRVDARPADVGMDESKLEWIRTHIRKDIEDGVSDGSIIVVARHGQVVMHEAIGFSDRPNGRKARVDDVLPVMSIAKQHTAALALKWIDNGHFAITSRVAEFIPEFGQKGKEHVTVRDLMSHQAGLPMQHPFEHFGAGNEKYVEILCETPYDPAPAGVVIYHAGAAHAVLGEIVRRCDPKNRPLRKIMYEEIYEPLGMADTALSFLDRPDLQARTTPAFMRGKGKDALSSEDVQRVADIAARVEFCAGGVFSTAYDEFRFAEMFRRGGALDGNRVLSPAVIAAATTNQTGNKIHGLFKDVCENAHMEPFPAYLGLSLYLRGEGTFVTNMGTLMSSSGFSGSGFGGQIFAVDPERDLTFVQLVVGFPTLLKSRIRSQRFSDLVISSVIN
ncbi:CubicO group peptidase, beta-lactamase class C family [Lutimaribacter pacificus]|uniref:CubicO group peptidase, beta-lactamase class C family n=1 Tax=Lutimaribacter pacificus TaxID=391948 RepID=A0A1H0IT91_9RHOB|nr:serine hydrolase domain-containing protein [Lutimaribacter pacificus]SDO34572.1 CubicO group peptidase, beta-lactamase class C family [Lutimaribacter pacificus]SHK17827.1 CubicO group peptidase, beta-lactamase class C family [Lutimaribacter pacificus]